MWCLRRRDSSLGSILTRSTSSPSSGSSTSSLGGNSCSSWGRLDGEMKPSGGKLTWALLNTNSCQSCTYKYMYTLSSTQYSGQLYLGEKLENRCTPPGQAAKPGSCLWQNLLTFSPFMAWINLKSNYRFLLFTAINGNNIYFLKQNFWMDDQCTMKSRSLQSKSKSTIHSTQTWPFDFA